MAAESYDYIIAGGGLAGCLLADRLSADGKKVLVLEAGRPDYNYLFIRIPAGILRLFRSKYDWQHETGGEKSCNGRNVYLQRGKVRHNAIGLERGVGVVTRSLDLTNFISLRFLVARPRPMSASTIGDQLSITTTGTFLVGLPQMSCHSSRQARRI